MKFQKEVFIRQSLSGVLLLLEQRHQIYFV